MASYASHINGGNISYECLGSDTFRVNLTLVRDCYGIAAPLSPSVTIDPSCNTSFTTTLAIDTSYYVYFNCDSTTSACNGGTIPGYEIIHYTGITTISDTCSITLSYNTCCRSSSLVNVTNSGSQMVDIQTIFNPQVAPCNNSVVVTSPSNVFLCANGSDTIPFSIGAYDPDGDELRYRFGCPPTTGFNYSFPHSCLTPIAGTSINPLTGEITLFEPMGLGTHHVGIYITELAPNGDTIADTYHEIMVTAINCAPDSNQRPNNPIVSNVTGGSYSSDLYVFDRVFTTCPGNTLCFDVEFSDNDSLDVLTYTSNLTQALPGAIVTSTGANPLTISVCWTSPTNLNNTTFTIGINDNYCNPAVVSHRMYHAFSIEAGGGYYSSLPDSTALCLGDTFTYSFCSTGSIAFNHVSGNSNYSGTITSTCSTCKTIWASPMVSGDYVLTNIDSGGVTTYDTIYIAVNSSANQNLITPTLLTMCEGDSLQINADSGLIVNWQAFYLNTGNNNNGVLTTTQGNSTTVFPYSGDDLLIVASYGSGNCVTTDSVIIDIQNLSDSIFIDSYKTICAGEKAYYNVSALADLTWTSASGSNMVIGTNISCDTCSNIWLSPDSTETYFLTETNGACSQVFSTVINVVHPFNNFNLPDTINVCEGDSVTANVSGFTGQISWYLKDEDNFPGLNIGYDSLGNVWSFPSNSGYLVCLHSYSNNGCTSKDSIYLNVLPVDNNIISSYDTTVCVIDSFSLYSNANGNMTWYASQGPSLVVGTNIECTDCNNPWVFPTATTTYSLENINQYGCYEYDNVTVQVDNESEVYGQITTSSGAPLTDSWIYFLATDSTGQNVIDSVYTDSLGYYNWTTFYLGDITILAQPNGQLYNDQYATYYDEVLDPSLATIVTLNGCGQTHVSFNTILITNIEDIHASLTVNVYPNPNQGYITVESNQTSTYQLFSINGQLLKSGNLAASTNQIDITEYENGMYIMHIKNKLDSRYISLIKE